MWRWIKSTLAGKTEVPRAEALYDPAKDDPLVQRIFFAAYLLDLVPDPSKSETDFVANLSLALLRRLKQDQDILRDREIVDFIDGLFLLCICNVYSSHMNISFEKASMKALVSRFPNGMPDTIPEILGNYNEMMRTEDDTTRMIFSTLLKWTNNPGTTELDKFRELYTLMLSHMK